MGGDVIVGFIICMIIGIGITVIYVIQVGVVISMLIDGKILTKKKFLLYLIPYIWMGYIIKAIRELE